MNALAVMLRRINHGWAVTLTDEARSSVIALGAAGYQVAIEVSQS